jgi:uncharacterized protein (TIGR02452 family)
MHLMSRKLAAQLGRDTLRILREGRYRTENGAVVELGDALRRAAEGTVSYPPDHRPPRSRLGPHETKVEVETETTLAAARRLVESGERPVALNFASAKHPGGGFLSGARAQEESLCRASGLYACLGGNAMYAYHRDQRDPMYSDYAVYSPDVPVFRDDDGGLLEEPYLCSFITSAAVNANVVLSRSQRSRPAVRAAMEQRVHKVLGVAADQGHETLVLGAWGCGVFGNDARVVAELFYTALGHSFRGAFRRVIFAVLDWSEERRFVGPFERLFGTPLC